MSTNKDTIASTERDVPTRTLFYRYWVMGMPRSEAAGNYRKDVFNDRPIPVRSAHDAKRLRYGDVSVHELWSKYLSDFQFDVARELRRERLNELRGS